jgi:uncharacterized protein YndB with AHSA1/START domain
MWGNVSPAQTGSVLTFERDIARPMEKVWAALITPARLADWLCADAELEPRVGGRFHLAFRNFSHTMTGEITRFEPPHVLEYTWTEPVAKGNSLVLWRLFPTPGGCRLVMTHTLPHCAPDDGAVADFASGWHWHIDALPAACDGVATAWAEPGWRSLREAYSARQQRSAGAEPLAFFATSASSGRLASCCDPYST